MMSFYEEVYDNWIDEMNWKYILTLKHKESFIYKTKLMSLCLMMALMTSGCASITKSTLLGIGTGVAIGGASGALIDKQNSSQTALTSALIMGVIGGVAGYFTHESLETRDAEVRKDTLFNLEKYGVSGFSNGPRKNYDTTEMNNEHYYTPNLKGENK